MKTSSLLFGLMASFEKNEYSTSDLKHLSAPFEITDTCLRTNLSRMSKKGLIKSRRQGIRSYYRFSKKGAAIKRNVALSFSTLDWGNWDNSWWAVLFSVPEIEKSKRYQIRKKLSAYRFASLYPGVWIRPLNVAENMEHRLEDIFTNKHCKILQFNYFNNISKDEISKLWKLKEINDSFKIGLKILYMKKDVNTPASPEQALIEKMVIGDSIVDILFKDPLLPEIYLPEDWKGDELKKEFFKWDREVTNISRPYWDKIFQET